MIKRFLGWEIWRHLMTCKVIPEGYGIQSGLGWNTFGSCPLESDQMDEILTIMSETLRETQGTPFAGTRYIDLECIR